MRKYFVFDKPIDNIKKLMLVQEDERVYLFLYNTIEDFGCCNDLWFETLHEAHDLILKTYGNIQNWIMIEDRMSECQQDFIEPVRIKGRNIGKTQWGSYEKLIDGKWVDFTPNPQR